MKFTFYDFVSTIKDLDNKEIDFSLDGKKEPQKLTLATAIRVALTTSLPGDKTESQLSDTQKYDDYTLATSIVRLEEGKHLNLDAKQVSRIIELCFKVFSKEVAGYIKDYLEDRIERVKAPVGNGDNNASSNGTSRAGLRSVGAGGKKR